MARYRSFILLVCIIFLAGCKTTFHRTSPHYAQIVQPGKTIMVLPPDIQVYQIRTGNAVEQIDEWTEMAKEHIAKALKTHLTGYKVEFVSSDQLNGFSKQSWIDNLKLYEAVSNAAMTHSYSGVNLFENKKENFDYTLGTEIGNLSKMTGGDLLLFIDGFDHDSSSGRMMIGYFNAAIMGALTGVMYMPVNPCYMSMGLVNAQTGDLEWFKVSPANMEYKFRNEKHMDLLVQWMLKELIVEK